MLDWVPYTNAYKGLRSWDRGDINIEIMWRGDAGGKNTEKHLKMDEETARELHDDLGDALGADTERVDIEVIRDLISELHAPDDAVGIAISDEYEEGYVRAQERFAGRLTEIVRDAVDTDS